MRLIHLTDQPATDYSQIISKRGAKNNQLFRDTSSMAFLQSERDQSDGIQATFERFNRARLQLEAPIVPNLCLTEGVASRETRQNLENPCQGFEVAQGKGPDSCEFILTFAT